MVKWVCTNGPHPPKRTGEEGWCPSRQRGPARTRSSVLLHFQCHGPFPTGAQRPRVLMGIHLGRPSSTLVLASCGYQKWTANWQTCLPENKLNWVDACGWLLKDSHQKWRLTWYACMTDSWLPEVDGHLASLIDWSCLVHNCDRWSTPIGSEGSLAVPDWLNHSYLKRTSTWHAQLIEVIWICPYVEYDHSLFGLLWMIKYDYLYGHNDTVTWYAWLDELFDGTVQWSPCWGGSARQGTSTWVNYYKVIF